MSDHDGLDRLDRIDSALENQYGVNSLVKKEIEALKATIKRQDADITELRETAQSLLQVAKIQQENLERLASELQKHRQDRHGGE
jgi:mevalonate kinase